MGRHSLSLAIQPDPGPVFLPRLLLLLLLFIINGVATLVLPPSTPTPTSMDRLGNQEVAVLKQRILEGLGITKVPDVTKMNVSQEEYARMYGVYLRSVEENRRRRQREMVQQQDGGVTVQRFYSFTHAVDKYNTFYRQTSVAQQFINVRVCHFLNLKSARRPTGNNSRSFVSLC
ncbi:hypothetical protein L9F63_020684, partial [Diploptera punctata]